MEGYIRCLIEIDWINIFEKSIIGKGYVFN